MNVLKSAMRCTECHKNLIKPMILACGSSVCSGHLEKLDNRTFQCRECEDDHFIDEKSLIVNKALESLINAKLENLNLGHDYNAAFNVFAELDQTINNIEVIKNHPKLFIKQAIDKLKNLTELIREEHKLKLDDKADTIIQQLENYQTECLENLDCSNLKAKIAIIDQNIANIKNDLILWQNSLNDFSSGEKQWKTINQSMNQLNSKLKKETSDFKKQILDHRITDHFSSVLDLQQLNQTSEYKLDVDMDEFKDILGNFDVLKSRFIDNKKRKELQTLCNISADKIWKLIYRGSEHGFTANDFHSKCDNVANTLTVIKSTCGSIFGGYTTQTWDQTAGYKNDPSAYLFSLINPQNQPSKLNVQNPSHAIYSNASYGPIFGSGSDLSISFTSNYSILGNSYQRRYSQDENDVGTIQLYLTKSQYFTILDIDIYQIV